MNKHPVTEAEVRQRIADAVCAGISAATKNRITDFSPGTKITAAIGQVVHHCILILADRHGINAPEDPALDLVAIADEVAERLAPRLERAAIRHRRRLAAEIADTIGDLLESEEII